MSADIQSGFIEMFDEITRNDMRFSKQTYAYVFEKTYEKYKNVFQEVEKLADEAEDRDALLHEIAESIPNHMAGKVELAVSKRKLDSYMIDYNLQMTTYILPLLNYGRTPACQQISEEMVRIWNKKFSTRIGNSTYEQIHSGFRERLCYITTAVCKDLDKPDNCYELETLRKYRDQYLLEEGHGTELVKEYYNTAPTIVKRIDQLENCNEVYQQIWSDYLLPCIQLIENDKKEDCKEVYSSMVRELQKKYLYS